MNKVKRLIFIGKTKSGGNSILIFVFPFIKIAQDGDNPCDDAEEMGLSAFLTGEAASRDAMVDVMEDSMSSLCAFSEGSLINTVPF